MPNDNKNHRANTLHDRVLQYKIADSVCIRKQNGFVKNNFGLEKIKGNYRGGGFL